MLQVRSNRQLGELEGALRHAAARQQGSILAVSHLGQLFGGSGAEAFNAAVCLPELYVALLEADVRMAAFLPCRVAAYAEGAHVTLATVSPLEFCRQIGRPDLAGLAGPLETALLGLMRDAACAPQAAAHAAAAPHLGGLGATEEQVSRCASVPQRIDCRGTKVEDLGGTGEHDAQGG